MANMNHQYDMIIVGAGASGMVAAISCKKYLLSQGTPARIAILERNAKAGKKLLATGNGRCNLSNANIRGNGFEKYYHSQTPSLVCGVLSQFDSSRVVQFFEELGILCFTQEDGRIYPYCREAFSVVEALEREIDKLGIDVFYRHEVVGVSGEKPFELTCSISGSQSIQEACFSARRLIIATGGKASPSLSSDGLGYPLAKQTGHSITPLSPGIVHLTVCQDINRQLKGLRWDVKASLIHSGSATREEKIIREESGELLFTEYGLSGPIIFQISRSVSAEEGVESILRIDLLPEFSKSHLAQLLPDRVRKTGGESAEKLLFGILPHSIVRAITGKVFGSSHQRTCSMISPLELARLIQMVKAYPFRITGTTGWENAQITMGGVAGSEINPQTLESLIRKGLYLSGELLDVDGDCGGYNLQFAWASGVIAGKNAALSLL
jgi:predicted Rossmann fold flavoprotein